MNSDTVNVSNRKAFVEKDGKMSWYSGMFGTSLCRFKTDSVMKGPGASTEDVEIVFGTEIINYLIFPLILIILDLALVEE